MRLLIVISRDYGELGSALYFIRGEDWGARPLLLVPDLGIPGDLGDFDCDLASYHHAEHIVEQIERYRPDALLLFSGYLLTMKQGRSVRSIRRVLRVARERKLPVFTTDPFLGALSRGDFPRFSSVLWRQATGAARFGVPVRAALLYCRFRVLHRLLSRIPHLYVAPWSDDGAREHTPRLSFFNENVLEQSSANATASDGQSPFWLFVLSDIDAQRQLALTRGEFLDALGNFLLRATGLGRTVVFVAPRSLLASLRPELHASDDIKILSAPTYTVYERLVLDAEIVFFWNYFSFSLIHRLLNAKPLFFFDEGHMGNVLPSLIERGVQYYYAGWNPPTLDIRDTPDPDRLARMTNEFQSAVSRIVERYRSSPSPRDLLRAQLDAGRAEEAQN